MPLRYFVRDKNAIVREVEGLQEYLLETEHGSYQVDRDNIEHSWDTYRVSTVFIGIVSSMSNPPQLFETKVFDGNFDEVFTYTSATEKEARKKHLEAIWDVYML